MGLVGELIRTGHGQMRLDKLARHVFDINAAAASVEINDITSSSDEVASGSMFFGLSGTKFDGADFASDAVLAGAACVAVSKNSVVENLSVPVLRHDNIRQAFALVCANWFEKQPKIVGAVTGTAGKTSVATFLRQIWQASGYSAASIGTTGLVSENQTEYGNLTTPDARSLHALLKRLYDESVTHVAMEASSHGLDQHRLDGVKLSVAGFTNLGRDHMDYHPTLDHYFDSKMLLLRERLPAGYPAVIFADDQWSEKAINVTREAGREVLSVGRNGRFIRLKKVEHQQFSQIIEVEKEGELYRIEFPLAGDFQVSNALVAAGMAIVSGVKPDDAFKSLENLHGAAGRLELVGRKENGAPVYVDYAHKPEALENVLRSVRPFTSGRIILVFGCGGDRDRGKRAIMGEIAARLSDEVIITDDNPRTEDPASIRYEILSAIPKAKEIADRSEAIEIAMNMLNEGDCLIVAGKGHEEGQVIGNQVFPFSDHQVVRSALRERDS